MATDKLLGGFMHGLGIERALHQPGFARINSKRRAAIDDAIKIMPTRG